MTSNTSMLDYILGMLTRNDSEREKKEMKLYDKMKFVDVNKELKKEIKEKLRNTRSSKD